MKFTILAAACLAMGATQASAGPIDGACMGAGRNGANGALCECIQQVADMTLSRSDQRRAAKLFKDPEKAQEVRMSDRKADEAFWDRYKNFAAAAEGYCGG